MTLTKQVCKSCLGKKQESVFKGPSVASADFPGDKSYIVDKGGIKMVDCSRCKGTGLEPVFKKEVNYAIKCSTEKQARECNKYKLYRFTNIESYREDYYKKLGHIIISYEEAQEKNLLGEHYQDTIKTVSIDSEKETTEQQSDVVEKLIEKRQKRFIQLQTYPRSEIHKAMRNEVGLFIYDLEHLSYK